MYTKETTMQAAQMKHAWQVWQDANQEEAARIRSRFATKAIEHGFAKAERYLMVAIMDKLNLSSLDEIHDVLR
jgi:phage/plasmid-associated DNA primase